MSFITGTQTELLYTLQAPVTKNTFTTEAAISGVAGTNAICTIPPGFFIENPDPVGRGLYLRAEGIIANTAAATFALQLGFDVTPGTKSANSLAVNAAYTPTAAVTAPWHLEAWCTCTAFATSTFSLQVNGTIVYESIATGGAPTTTTQRAGFQAILTGIDPRVQLYPELFGTWSASSASNTTTLQQEFLFGLN